MEPIVRDLGNINKDSTFDGIGNDSKVSKTRL